MKLLKNTFCLFAGLLIFLQSPLCAQQAALKDQINPPPKTGNKTLSNTIQMTDIHDIKTIEKTGFNPALLWYAALGAVLLALLTAAFLYWKKRKQKKIPELVASILPQEAALNLLESIADLMYSNGKQFYFRLSIILREYIRQRFGVDAPEMTTEELLAKMKEIEMDRGLARGVREFALAGDPVKFAEQPAEIETMKGHLEFVRTFVQQTTPPSSNITNNISKNGGSR